MLRPSLIAGRFSFDFDFRVTPDHRMSSSSLLDDADAAMLVVALSFLDGTDESLSDIVPPPHAPLGRREEPAAVKYTTQHQLKRWAKIAALRKQICSTANASAHVGCVSVRLEVSD
jgi:hypothetical protein